MRVALSVLVVVLATSSRADDARSASGLTPEVQSAAQRIMRAHASFQEKAPPIHREVVELRGILRRIVRDAESEGGRPDWSLLGVRRTSIAREAGVLRTSPSTSVPEEVNGVLADRADRLLDRLDELIAESGDTERARKARQLLTELEYHDIKRQFSRRQHRQPTFLILAPPAEAR